MVQQVSVKRLRQDELIVQTSYGHYQLAPLGLERIAALADVEREHDGEN